MTQSINVGKPITALALTEGDSHIMLGLKDGKLILLAVSHHVSLSDICSQPAFFRDHLNPKKFKVVVLVEHSLLDLYKFFLSELFMSFWLLSWADHKVG